MTKNRSKSLRLVLIGAGGHARVLQALAQSAGHCIVGVCDPTLRKNGLSNWQNISVFGDDDALSDLDPGKFGIINGIGQVVGSTQRMEVFERIKQMGFSFPFLVHPAAWVAESAKLKEGVQVMAGAIVQPDCRIGVNSIINTKASIDHDCKIGAHVHVAPGATLCGGVSVGDGAFIGANATLLPGIRIGSKSIVGAGTTVLKPLNAGAKVIGAPARSLANPELGHHG
jgi:UDP-perosamine 4-acetyltransferase